MEENKIKQESVSKLGSLFIRNNDNYDYGEMQKFYLQKEWEYEKRAVSSLLIGSGGGLSLMLANAKIESKVLALTPFVSATSILLFLLSLLLAGTSQFVLNEAAALNYRKFTVKSNHQTYVQAIEKIDKLKSINAMICLLLPAFEANDEVNADSRFQAVDRANVAKSVYLRLEKKAKKIEKTATIILLLACLFFVSPIIFIVISVIGNIL